MDLTTLEKYAETSDKSLNVQLLDRQYNKALQDKRLSTPWLRWTGSQNKIWELFSVGPPKYALL
jgi:hypothetical protein